MQTSTPSLGSMYNCDEKDSKETREQGLSKTKLQ